MRPKHARFLNRLLLVYFSAYIIFGCSQSVDSAKNKRNEVVLIDAGDASRTEIADALSKLDVCHPKVIGINFLFERRAHNQEDTLLADAIKTCSNVVMTTAIRDRRLVHSDPFFVKNSANEGLVSFRTEDKVALSEMIFKSYRDSMLYSLSYMMVIYFDPARGTELMHQTKGNTFYKIEAKLQRSALDVLSIEQLDTASCKRFQDKIVIIGTTEFDANIRFRDSSGEEISQLEILGSNVLNLLDGSVHEDTDLE